MLGKDFLMWFAAADGTVAGSIEAAAPADKPLRKRIEPLIALDRFAVCSSALAAIDDELEL